MGGNDVEKKATFGVWKYYINDEGRARWKRSECGKLCKRIPTDKIYCSQCGAKMRMES